MKLDDIYRKYNVPKKTATDISRELKDDKNVSYEYVRERLKEYPVEPGDLDELKDEFTNIKADIIRPFLLTKVNLTKYKKVSGYRGGMAATAKVDSALVFASKDGTEKVYLIHYHDLSRESWQSLMQDIKHYNPNIAFLMTKSEYNNLYQ